MHVVFLPKYYPGRRDPQLGEFIRRHALALAPLAQVGVVAVLFEGTAPRIQELVYAGELAMEVASLLANGAARCMALAPVRGLGLGMTVRATGAPIEVPVGDAVLGRMLNVFGEPLDGKPAPVAVARRSIQ